MEGKIYRRFVCQRLDDRYFPSNFIMTVKFNFLLVTEFFSVSRLNSLQSFFPRIDT